MLPSWMVSRHLADFKEASFRRQSTGTANQEIPDCCGGPEYGDGNRQHRAVMVSLGMF